VKSKFTESAIQIYKRYVKLVPVAKEDLILFLLDADRVREAIPIFEELSKNEKSNLKSGKSREEFEFELCELISKFPDQCSGLTESPITVIRNLIQKYNESKLGYVGLLWVYLAEFFIRLGQFGLARDIFEEALQIEPNGVKTARDFTIVFNSYVKFERQMMAFEDLVDLQDPEQKKAGGEEED